MEEKKIVKKLATATLVSGAMLLAVNKPSTVHAADVDVKNNTTKLNHKNNQNKLLLRIKLKKMLIRLKAKEIMQNLKLMKLKRTLTKQIKM